MFLIIPPWCPQCGSRLVLRDDLHEDGTLCYREMFCICGVFIVIENGDHVQ